MSDAYPMIKMLKLRLVVSEADNHYYKGLCPFCGDVSQDLGAFKLYERGEKVSWDCDCCGSGGSPKYFWSHFTPEIRKKFNVED